MALRNGLLVHGPTHWAVAVRNKAGEIEVASGAKPSFARGPPGHDAPRARARCGSPRRWPSSPSPARACAPHACPSRTRRVIVAAAMASAASAAARKFARGNTSREAMIALLGLVPALAALRDPDLAAYHGAEHKAIGAYESGGPAADEPKEHERCGSNLIGPMLAFSVAGQVLVEGHAWSARTRSRAAPRPWRQPALPSRCSPSPSATPMRRSPAPFTARDTRSSAWSRPASRPPSSSTSARRPCVSY